MTYGGPDLVELVNRMNRADNPMEEIEVEKWARGGDEENLDIEILEDDETSQDKIRTPMTKTNLFRK